MKTSILGLFVLSLCVVSCEKQETVPTELVSLVGAERDFARTCGEKGIRASFLQFFAEEGLSFEPEPTRVREAYSKRPAPKTLPPVTLSWYPVFADVSQADDLGYTTGPYIFTDRTKAKPPHCGFYFSIWKKQADGSWKVVIDCGIDTPDHSSKTLAFKSPRRTNFTLNQNTGSAADNRATLIHLDQSFSDASVAGEAAKTFLDYLADDARVHRNGILPVTDKKSARKMLSEVRQAKWEPIGSDLSQSADLGYTYGRYHLKFFAPKAEENGYYVRVWKREPGDAWKIVLDTLRPTRANEIKP